jgi:hypothetical protein
VNLIRDTFIKLGHQFDAKWLWSTERLHMVRVGQSGGPGRIRTSDQTVMSGLAAPEILDKIGVFHRVHARLFASVHVVSVVDLWSVSDRCDDQIPTGELAPKGGTLTFMRHYLL